MKGRRAVQKALVAMDRAPAVIASFRGMAVANTANILSRVAVHLHASRRNRDLFKARKYRLFSL